MPNTFIFKLILQFTSLQQPHDGSPDKEKDKSIYQVNTKILYLQCRLVLKKVVSWMNLHSSQLLNKCFLAEKYIARCWVILQSLFNASRYMRRRSFMGGPNGTDAITVICSSVLVLWISSMCVAGPVSCTDIQLKR